MISKDSIDSLKNIIDIVEIVESYVELKKNGSNYKACCPFHDEKTPSFVVNEQRGMYHCFGCGAGGDAIKFVMDLDNINFQEAIEKIASIYNFELSYDSNNSNIVKKDLLKPINLLNKFYKKELVKNIEALTYLKNRGIYESTIEKFEIGFAPQSFESINYLKKHEIDLNDALDSGVVAKDRDFYARFINRITFPIYSNAGAVIGFGGRTISNHPAKYINSPQSAIFNKSSLLYGFHLAKKDIYKQNEVVITEGYLDVIMLNQAGFTNVVATLGTALTLEHIPLLNRLKSKVILAFDGDNAGVNAALKASYLLAGKFDGGVVLFRDGADPADLVADSKEKEVEKLLKNPKAFIEFILEEIAKEFDLNNPFQKNQALQKSLEFLKPLSSVVKSEYKGFLASLLTIDISLIKFKEEKTLYLKSESKPTNNQVDSQKLSNSDIAELTILKTLLIKPHLLDVILDRCDEKLIFDKYMQEIESIKEERLDEPELRAILLNETIHICNEIELQKSINYLLIRIYTKDIQILKTDKNLSYEEKRFYIKKSLTNIEKLKRGELLMYDGCAS